MVIVVVMVVVAMLVMMMVISVVIVIVVTMIMRGVIMCGMVVRSMIMGAVLRAGLRRMGVAFSIGAAFGIERRLDLGDAGAKPLHHRLDHMIAADAQAFCHDLRRQMPVAEMPGDPDQMLRIVAADFHQRFRCRDHLDQPAVFQHQRITAAQGDGVFQIEQEFEPARARHRHPPPMPVVEIEHDGIGRGVRPVMLTLNSGGADHADLSF